MQARDAEGAGWAQLEGANLAGWKLAMNGLSVKQDREIAELNLAIVHHGPVAALARRHQKEVGELMGAFDCSVSAPAGIASTEQQQRGTSSTASAASRAAATDWTQLHLQPTRLQHPQQQEQEQQQQVQQWQEVDEQHPQVPWRLEHQQQQEQEQPELEELFESVEGQQGHQQQDQTAQQQPVFIPSDEEQRSLEMHFQWTGQLHSFPKQHQAKSPPSKAKAPAEIIEASAPAGIAATSATDTAASASNQQQDQTVQHVNVCTAASAPEGIKPASATDAAASAIVIAAPEAAEPAAEDDDGNRKQKRLLHVSVRKMRTGKNHQQLLTIHINCTTSSPKVYVIYL